MLCEKLSNLRLDRLGQQRSRAAAQDLCQGVGENPWLGELDDVTVGHGVSLLHWRSGGVGHHHDTPPYPSARHQLPAIAQQTLLSNAVVPQRRTSIFATYILIGSVLSAVGCLFASAPEIVARTVPIPPNRALQGMFLLYAFLGAIAFMIYRQLKSPAEAPVSEPASGPLGPSRRIVLTLAALFSLDSFGGGFFVQSLLALWLFDHFGLSLTAAGSLFFWSGLLSAFSYPIAVRLARRIGLVNTMVFTHLPSNVCLMLVPFAPTLEIAIALLLIKSTLSQMDVPARTSYVMAVVTPSERPAAASVTAAPRSLAGAASPVLAGCLLGLSSFGWPLVLGGGLNSLYDLLLLFMFRKVRRQKRKS